MSGDNHNQADSLNLDAILARVDDEDFYPAHDELEADVRALVAEVRRLREAFAQSVEDRARLEDIIAERA